ncbi:NAD(P)-binding protein [Oceanobacillus sp. FSL K6-2867]|uniref:NAD(P)-binding protein n=1 Tax=Oceanobacillus sp. FSL K6-2867 TaxID=2954748 RepID=UPI0030DD22BF
MPLTPLMVNLSGKNIVLVGGGYVAGRRIQTLLESGAQLTVISPEIGKEVRVHWEKGRIKWIQKHVEPNDLDGAFLIIVATNNPIVNQSIILAAPPNALVNAAADAVKGNVEFPSAFRRGKLAISISTNGASPQLTRKIKEQLQTIYNENYETYVEFLFESRQLIKRSVLNKMEQKQLLKELLSEVFLDPSKQRQTIAWLNSFFS